MKSLLDSVHQFIEQVYFVDVCAVGAMYADWLKHGAGVTNYPSVPDLPLDGKARSSTSRRHHLQRRPVEGHTDFLVRDPYFQKNVTESIAHSWHDGTWQKHPWKKRRFRTVRRRRREEALVDQVAAFRRQAGCRSGRSRRCSPALRRDTADEAVGREDPEVAGKVAGAADAGRAPLHARPSCAHAIRCTVISELAGKHWRCWRRTSAGRHRHLQRAGVPEARAAGLRLPRVAPRGTLSHWIVIQDGKIKNYQAVVPSTWNAGPRDAEGQPGPYEASAPVGNPVADPGEAA